MTQKSIVLLCVMLTMTSYALAGEKEEESLKIGDPAPRFTLKDADDKEHSLDALLGVDKEHKRVVILMMGDRKVRKEANKWARELHKLYEKNKDVAMLMVADLRDLPFFVTEGMVKWGTKREKLPVTIVLDWEGKVNEQYKTRRGKPNLVIVNREGRVAYRDTAPYSEEALKKLQAKLQESLRKEQHKQN